MDDLISRQAVIEMLDETRRIAERNIDGAVLMTFEKVLDSLVNITNALPNIQPEIVRCKDCKHHWTHRCMDSMPIERCDLGQTFYDAEVDFCSLAEKREVTT